MSSLKKFLINGSGVALLLTHIKILKLVLCFTSFTKVNSRCTEDKNI